MLLTLMCVPLTSLISAGLVFVPVVPMQKVKSKVQERIASEFRPAAFYEARQDVANFLFRNAVEALSDEAVTIHDLQLRQADLPPTVEDKINEALRLEEVRPARNDSPNVFSRLFL